MGVTLDTGALIALGRGDPRTRRLIDAYANQGQIPAVPTVALAEAWRDGRRQARLVRLLGRCELVPLTARLAMRAGELMGRVGTSDAVDAVIACAAAERGDAVVTSDPNDFARFTANLRQLRVSAI